MEDIGLTEAESKVYLMLLKNGSSLAGTITKETGIHRRTVYDILYRLRSKGLVSNILTNNKRYFEAADPDKLLEIIKEREENIKGILPELKLFYKTIKNKKEVTFFRGKQALKTIFDDQIKEGREILFIGKGINLDKISHIYFHRFDAARIKKNIKMRMVFDAEAKNILSIPKIPLTEIRYIKNWNDSRMSTHIYGNNVCLVLWDEDEPLAILIRQKEIADGFRNYFNILWDIGSQ